MFQIAQRNRMLEGLESLDRSSASVERSRRIAAETGDLNSVFFYCSLAEYCVIGGLLLKINQACFSIYPKSAQFLSVE